VAEAGPSPAAEGKGTDEPGLTLDRLLEGRLMLVQPARGHRAGTDALLVAAAAGSARHVVDLGSGVGAIGLALLALGRAERATLVEREPDLAALARRNVALNAMDRRCAVVEADVTARASLLAAAGLEPGLANLVVCNPPYHEPGRHRSSPDARRLAAHAMAPESFEAWARAAARSLRGDGRLVLIHRPEALAWLLPLLARRFGALEIIPVHGRADQAAMRVLIRGRLNSRAPARVLPALVLHGLDGSVTGPGHAISTGELRLEEQRGP
jgi:tRNA1(Val) A37 N6-methylase TrmN6